MSPFFMVGMSPPYKCKSEPQIAVSVTRITASRGLIILGSGTFSMRTSSLPYQQTAFIYVSPSFFEFLAFYFVSAAALSGRAQKPPRRVALRSTGRRVGKRFEHSRPAGFLRVLCAVRRNRLPAVPRLWLSRPFLKFVSAVEDRCASAVQ